MAPNDGDQSNERESRVEEMMKGYRRDHSPMSRRPQDERPQAGGSVPPNGRGRRHGSET